MTAYADPELLIGEWLRDHVGDLKVWLDPKLDPTWRFVAPLAHVQRAPGFGELALSLDDVQLDVDVYSAVADTARAKAHEVWNVMKLELPLTTFPNGVFVKRVTATAPFWAPDPKVYRRTAGYRVILHGFVE